MKHYTRETSEKTEKLIIKKFNVNEKEAKKYAELALEGLYSHGGDTTNFNNVKSIVNTVVKSLIEE